MLDDIKRAIHEVDQIIQAMQQRAGPNTPEVVRRGTDALDCLVRVKGMLEHRQAKERLRRLGRKVDG